jgi:DNA-binding response OmpR family regulator
MNKVKIFFLVDDDLDDHEFFKDALKEIDPSIKCITAINADEAFQKLKEWKGAYPDFIILDLNLPRMNGKKCLIEIKKDKAFGKVPVIMYSTTSEKKVIQEMEDLGAAYFISKPNNLSLLCDSLRFLLSVDWPKKPVM